MFSITREVIFLLLLIVINGLFAMSEIAVVSARKARLEKLSRQGNLEAKAALRLANNPNQILSTVQIGITLVGIFAGAYGGATLAAKLGNFFQEIYFFPEQSDAIALALVVLMITYLSLVIGELVPKRLGLAHPEPIACKAAIPLQYISKMAAPIVYFLSASTDFILNAFFPKQEEADAAVTRTEIRVLVDEGMQAGTIEAAEQNMVRGVLQLNDYKASSLMTPRSKMIWLDLDDSIEQNRHKIIESSLSCFPVCHKTLKNVVGFAQVSDLLSASLQGNPFDLSKSLQRPIYILETTKGLEVLEIFKQTHHQMALVVDESGSVKGMISLNEILEAIIGNLPAIRNQMDN